MGPLATGHPPPLVGHFETRRLLPRGLAHGEGGALCRGIRHTAAEPLRRTSRNGSGAVTRVFLKLERRRRQMKQGWISDGANQQELEKKRGRRLYITAQHNNPKQKSHTQNRTLEALLTGHASSARGRGGELPRATSDLRTKPNHAAGRTHLQPPHLLSFHRGKVKKSPLFVHISEPPERKIPQKKNYSGVRMYAADTYCSPPTICVLATSTRDTPLKQPAEPPRFLRQHYRSNPAGSAAVETPTRVTQEGEPKRVP